MNIYERVSMIEKTTPLSNENLTNALKKIGESQNRVAVVGSMNADYTIVADRLPNPGETVNGSDLRVLPGGKSGNQAVSAAKIGANVQMFGAVGSDENAEFLLNTLESAGVDTSKILRVEGIKSGATVITVDAKAGENTIVYAPGSNAKVSVEYISQEDVKKAISSTSVLGLCLESPMETVTEAAKIARTAGVKVLLNNSPFVSELPRELIKNASILLVNEHEMAQLLKIHEPEDGNWDDFDWFDAARIMHEYGFDEAVVTLGAEGSVVLDYNAEDGKKAVRICPQKVSAVDTTGCGDAFMGTVLAGLAAGFSLAQSAQVATYVSAYAATGFGAQSSYGSAQQVVRAFE